MAKKQIGLGRGFESLLPKDFEREYLVDEADKIKQIELAKLMPNDRQPRVRFDDAELASLAASIKRYGVLQPLVVTPEANSGGFMIIAGERRARAAKLAGLKTVPAIARTTKEIERLELALVENVQRVDLSPLEQAASIEYLSSNFSVNYDEIAKRLGKGTSTIANLVRLLGLPDNARAALAAGKISEGHARQILALKSDPAAAETLLKNILDYGWTVAKAEQFVVALKKHASGDEKAASARLAPETPETKALAKRLKTTIKIHRSAHGGRLEISFKTDEDLSRIIKMISS